jgi:hypothetical protein
MAKLNLSRKKSKKNKQNKQKKTARKQWKGGKCGCSSSFFSGGNANLAPYPLNTFDNDPQRALVSTRIMPNMQGGKRHLRKMNTRKRQQQRKMKGGFAQVMTGTDVSLRNPISSGLSMQGVINSSNIFTGNQVSYASPYMSNQVSNLVV